MDISIVVPLFNEEESLPELCSLISKEMDEHGYSYEIIFINDGSNDNSWQVIQKLKAENPFVKGISFRRNYGKSAALQIGFQATSGNVVITMDADLQDNPKEISKLYKKITEENFDIISGWKKKRYDNALTKNLPSKLYNATARKVTGIKLHDMNCGLKAYRSDVVKNIEVYGEMHRYIPYLAKNAGFGKIGEMVVEHRKRQYGTSKFGLDRFVHGYLDLFSLYFLSRFGKRPMHFFGLWGSIMFVLGFIAICIVGLIKIIAISKGVQAPLVTDTSYFYLALTLMLLGTQMFLAGFLGEMISRNSATRNDYQINDRIE